MIIAPRSHSPSFDDALTLEVAGEQAAALGRQGKRLERALSALTLASDDNRGDLIDEAADAVWSMMIQREAMGLVAHQDIIQLYNVPRAGAQNRYLPCVTGRSHDLDAQSS